MALKTKLKQIYCAFSSFQPQILFSPFLLFTEKKGEARTVEKQTRQTKKKRARTIPLPRKEKHFESKRPAWPLSKTKKTKQTKEKQQQPVTKGCFHAFPFFVPGILFSKQHHRFASFFLYVPYADVRRKAHIDRMGEKREGAPKIMYGQKTSVPNITTQ